MKRLTIAFVLLLLSGAALAQTPAIVRRGIVNDSEGGPILYAFAVPLSWQDGRKQAVLFPDFSMATPNPDPLAQPVSDLVEPLLAANYAVVEFRALRHRTWKPHFRPDSAVSYEFFRQFGAASEQIYIGNGLSGLEVAKYAVGFANGGFGALATCAPLAADRHWDRALDLRLAYDSICANVAGGALPRGAQPWPWALDLNAIPSTLTDFGPADHPTYSQSGTALAACTGIDRTPVGRTPAQQANLARLMDIAGVQDEEQFRTAFGFAVFALSDLVRRDFQPGLAWFGNHRAVYADAALNAAIARVPADPMYSYYFKEQVIPHRNWRDGTLPAYPVAGFRPPPLLALQTDADGNVPVAGLGHAMSRIHPTAIAGALIRADGRCTLSVQERMAGVFELAQWTRAGGARPTPASLQQRCVGASSDPARCRFVATAPPSDLAGVYLPRVPALPIDGRYSGQWYDPQRPGEGLIVQVLADQRALIYWFTYPAVGEAGDQLWLFGVGRVDGDTIRWDDVYRTRRLANNTVDAQRWGSLQLQIARCSAARFTWQGPANYGSGERQLSQLLYLQQQNCNEATPWPMNDTLSGIWEPYGNIPPFGAGEGFAFESTFDRGAVITRFYYDGQGLPRWSVGTSQGLPCLEFTGTFCDLWSTAFVRPHGTRFGAAFVAADIRIEDAGRYGFSSSGNYGNYHSVTVEPTPERPVSLSRITVPLGSVSLNTLWRPAP